jgi:hypothetical protein
MNSKILQFRIKKGKIIDFEKTGSFGSGIFPFIKFSEDYFEQ